MQKLIFLFFSLFLLLPYGSHASTEVCTMEYAPVCGQPPMPPCPPGMACIQAFPQPKTYGNACMMRADDATLIHTGECTKNSLPGGKACTREYAPVCGSVQVQCIQAPCDPVRTDYGNRCMAEAAGATDITSGTCDTIEPVPPIVGGDGDTHGCIGSAGYVWDASLKACIRPWEYQGVVDWAYDKKITRYSELSTFQYGNTLTRQEAAAFITRYLIDGLGRTESLCSLTYKDAHEIDTSLSLSIRRACGLSVMRGSSGYFYPRHTLTRGEALAVLIRAIDQKMYDERVNPWYQGYMDRAYELGLGFANMKGFDESITRGEFVEWLKKLSEAGAPSTGLLGEWQLDFYKLDDMLIPGDGVSVNFGSDRYSAKICNTINGGYTAKEGMIQAAPALSTLMACPDTNLDIIERAWSLDGATYSIQNVPEYTRIHLTIRPKSGGEYRFFRSTPTR